MPSYPSCKDAGADGNQAVDDEARGPHMEHETQITGIPPHRNLNLEKSGETLEKNLGETMVTSPHVILRCFAKKS
jgi:hypothetical protein